MTRRSHRRRRASAPAGPPKPASAAPDTPPTPAVVPPRRPWATEHGDRAAAGGQILRTTVGSGVHGVALPGCDDHDEMGVYVEAPDTVFGVREADGHYTARTAREGQRSHSGDTDLVLYSLRTWLALAAAGNPTVLIPLFAPDVDVLHITDAGRRLRAEAPPLVLSRQAGHRFLGYLRGQRERVTTGRRVPNRPELVAAHGFDTKYASHALRLGYQGVELLTAGTITLPMPEPDRQRVLAVKRGDVDRATALAWIDRQAESLQAVLDRADSPLPERPNLGRLAALSTDLHLDTWGTP